MYFPVEGGFEASLARTRDRAAPLRLPREMVAFAVAMPPVLYVLLDPGAFRNDAGRAVRSLVVTALYTLVCAVATHASFRFVSRTLPERFPTWLRAAAHVAGISALVAVSTFLVDTIAVRIGLSASCDAVLAIVRNIVISLLYAAVGVTTIRVRERIGRMRERAHAAREAALEARLRTLTARTNPHFLFNTINVGMSLITVDPEKAEDHFARLSALFRYSLEGSQRRFVQIGEELEAVRDYLEIERARFDARLAFSVRTDDSLDGVLVPPMSILPLVENAVLHGISPRVEGGTVTVTVGREERDLVVKVEDDGVGVGASTHRGSGTALTDLEERLAIVYGPSARVRKGSAASGGGFLAEIRLPVGP